MGSRQGKSLQKLKEGFSFFLIVIVLELSEFGPDSYIMESDGSLSNIL